MQKEQGVLESDEEDFDRNVTRKKEKKDKEKKYKELQAKDDYEVDPVADQFILNIECL